MNELLQTLTSNEDTRLPAWHRVGLNVQGARTSADVLQKAFMTQEHLPMSCKRHL